MYIFGHFTDKAYIKSDEKCLSRNIIEAHSRAKPTFAENFVVSCFLFLVL